MTGVLLVVVLAFVVPGGGVEVTRMVRPVANAQACAVTLAHLRPLDFHPRGPLLHFEASCAPDPGSAPAPRPDAPRAGPLPKDAT